MKKIIIAGLIVTVLLALTSTAIYADYLNEQKTVKQNLKQLETESLSIQDNFYSDPMFDWLYSQYTNPEEREYLIEEYAYTKFFHHMTDAESTYLYQLAKEGKDFYELLRVYEFWKTTTEPMKMIGTIYANCPDEPDSGWEYKEYMKLTGREDEILTKNEIDSYLENGLTEYDIVYARQLSGKNTHSPREILNQKKEHKNWVDISDEVYSKVNTKYRKTVKKGLFQNKNVSGKQMYMAESISNKTGGDVCDYLMMDNLEYAKENYENQTMAKIRQGLIATGHLVQKETTTPAYQEKYTEKLIAMGLTDEEIANYQEKGWDYTAIYNAKLLSDRKNISMDSVFSQMKADIPFDNIQ